MIDAMKDDRANSQKKVNSFCKKFGFIAGMLIGALTGDRKKNA
jgi:hypothetical protein